jgi:CBS domain-containing protein
MTRVEEVMSKTVVSCHEHDTLNRCAQIMWDHDCGCVPIVDDLLHVLGIITDRDVCMSAYLQGRTLNEISAAVVCDRPVRTCKRSDSVTHAEALMTMHQVRRLPVVDEAGRLVGMLALGDLARHLAFIAKVGPNSQSARDLTLLVEAVSRPRDVIGPEAHAGDISAQLYATL